MISDAERIEKLERLREALRFVKDFSLAVDAGAHVGLWSRVMADCFERVVAFEPLERNCLLWTANMRDRENAFLYRLALMDKHCRGYLEGEGHSLHYVLKGGSGTTAIWTLDELTLPVSFIKVDCEGADALVLKGAEKTLREHKPVVMVESIDSFRHRYSLPPGAALAYLEGLGMERACQMGNDYVYIWR
jgi:FkbM family methyltransferase